jgi:hypothetical protein
VTLQIRSPKAMLVLANMTNVQRVLAKIEVTMERKDEQGIEINKQKMFKIYSFR